MARRCYAPADFGKAAVGQDSMDNDVTGAQSVRALALARGLSRAHELFPETVAAAVARGGKALSPLPAEFSPLTEPASVFDPARVTESR
jgi:hypothetical protein